MDDDHADEGRQSPPCPPPPPAPPPAAPPDGDDSNANDRSYDSSILYQSPACTPEFRSLLECVRKSVSPSVADALVRLVLAAREGKHVDEAFALFFQSGLTETLPPDGKEYGDGEEEGEDSKPLLSKDLFEKVWTLEKRLKELESGRAKLELELEREKMLREASRDYGQRLLLAKKNLERERDDLRRELALTSGVKDEEKSDDQSLGHAHDADGADAALSKGAAAAAVPEEGTTDLRRQLEEKFKEFKETVRQMEERSKERDEAAKEAEERARLEAREETVMEMEKKLRERDEAIKEMAEKVREREEVERRTKEQGKMLKEMEERVKERDQRMDIEKKVRERDRTIREMEDRAEQRARVIEQMEGLANQREKTIAYLVEGKRKERETTVKEIREKLRDRDGTIKEMEETARKIVEAVKEMEEAARKQEEKIKGTEEQVKACEERVREAQEHSMEREEALGKMDERVKEREGEIVRLEAERDALAIRTGAAENEAVELRAKQSWIDRLSTDAAFLEALNNIFEATTSTRDDGKRKRSVEDIDEDADERHRTRRKV
jgi:hypothetical protein